MSTACATIQTAPGTPSISELIERHDARVMWVGAHPDDETSVSPLLARACIALKRPCLFLVYNRGDGGRCPFPQGCHPDLGSVRAHELALVAKAYNAELLHYRFWNAPLPVESFPPRPEIGTRWKSMGDPGALAAAAIDRFRPTILLTFDPDHGFTGHPEHQLSARFGAEGVRRATYRVPNTFHVVNAFWPMRLAGAGDPATPTDTFETSTNCGPPAARTCLDVAFEITKLHKTQQWDMARARSLRPLIGEVFFARFDAAKVPSPLE
jgi:LmbE family N-acetylglucosaminyl deacetylase